MGGFSTTPVAAEGNYQQTNPIQMIEALANTQNALNQNKFFQAKTLAGQYLEQATGPDGQPDLGRFSASLQSDPRTAVFAPEILQGVANLRGTGIANVQAGTNLARSQETNLQQDIASAGNDPKGIASITADGVRSGRYTADQVASMNADGTAYRTAVIEAGNPAANTAMTGEPTAVSTPQGTYIQNVNPYTNQVNPMGGSGSFIPNLLSKKDLATPVETLDNNGNKTLGILGDYMNQDSSWKDGAPHPLTALSPLSSAASGALGSGYGQQISNFEQLAGSTPGQKRLLEILRADADQIDSGPHSGFWTNLGELSTEYGLGPITFDPNKPFNVAATETFNKIIPQLINQQASILHLNDTDTSRQIASAAIPTTATSPEGRRRMIDLLESNADMIGAMGKTWEQQKSKLGAQAPASWGNFQIEFPNRVPPSIFQAQYMTPQEKSQMMKGWSQNKINDWNARYSQAEKLGWLPNAPGQ